MYDLSYSKDLKNINSKRSDEMLLLFGDQYSYFYSYRNYIVDSLREANPAEYRPQIIDNTVIAAKTTLRKTDNTETLIINKGINQLTCLGRIGVTDYQYKEDFKAPKWNITSTDSITILGYKCRKAITHYHGRDWTVWFTPDILTGEGPWKLKGLPGLVLKAEDSEAHYVFQCISLERSNSKKLITESSEKDFRLITKKEFFKESKRIYEDFLSYYDARPAFDTEHITRKYNPIELDE